MTDTDQPTPKQIAESIRDLVSDLNDQFEAAADAGMVVAAVSARPDVNEKGIPIARIAVGGISTSH